MPISKFHQSLAFITNGTILARLNVVRALLPLPPFLETSRRRGRRGRRRRLRSRRDYRRKLRAAPATELGNQQSDPAFSLHGQCFVECLISDIVVREDAKNPPRQPLGIPIKVFSVLWNGSLWPAELDQVSRRASSGDLDLRQWCAGVPRLHELGSYGFDDVLVVCVENILFTEPFHDQFGSLDCLAFLLLLSGVAAFLSPPFRGGLGTEYGFIDADLSVSGGVAVGLGSLKSKQQPSNGGLRLLEPFGKLTL